MRGLLQTIPNTDRGSQIRVLVVGDSSVGKTTFCSLYCNNELVKPSPTVGVSIEVKLHEYHNTMHFIELWDISGASVYDQTRHFLYGVFHGVILMHDLTARKTYESLRRWTIEIADTDDKPTPTPTQVLA